MNWIVIVVEISIEVVDVVFYILIDIGVIGVKIDDVVDY